MTYLVLASKIKRHYTSGPCSHFTLYSSNEVRNCICRIP